jgi:hypothetical protein
VWKNAKISRAKSKDAFHAESILCSLCSTVSVTYCDTVIYHKAGTIANNLVFWSKFHTIKLHGSEPDTYLLEKRQIIGAGDKSLPMWN